MAFPELVPALRKAWHGLRHGYASVREGMGSDVLELGLSEKENVTFSTGPWGPDYYRKFPRIWERLGGYAPSWSGESVSEQSALNNSVAWCCTRVISESVGFLPLSMMQQRGDLKQVADHPAQTALHNSPNDEMSAMTYRELLTAHVVTRGNCYSYITRRSGRQQAYEFIPIDPTRVHPDRDKSGKLTYEIEKDKTYTVQRGRPHEILHIRGLGYDGVCGYSVIAMARQSIGTAAATEKYAAKYFATGGRQPGYIKTAQQFRDKTDREKFREEMEGFLSNSENYHKLPIFPPNVEFQSYGWNPQDSQFLETRQWTIPEICRWFLIQPHMVGDLSRATFSNIEHLALQFVKLTLTAWLTRWEQDLWRCVLTPEEKAAGYFFKHNVNGLLRGDFQSRMQGYASALQNGHMTIDEVRDLEDRNALPNGAGKASHIQLNMQTLPGSGEPTSSERAAQAKTQQGNVSTSAVKDIITDANEAQVRSELQNLRFEVEALKEAQRGAFNGSVQ